MTAELRAYSVRQIREAERPHLAEGEPLMQRAADGLAAEIERLLGARGADPGHVLFLIGSGNNGGDGLYAAARLASAGVRATVFPVGEHSHDEGLAAALGSGAVLVPEHERTGEHAAALTRDADIVVDAILGTGAGGDAGGSPALRGLARDIVERVMLVLDVHPTGVVAVDIPSGIGPDDGSVPSAVVLPADVTVTMGALKIGLFRQPARALAGRVVLVPVGIERELARVTATPIE